MATYTEELVSALSAYHMGWFIAAVYAPTLVSVLAWLSARYFCVLVGWDSTGGACMLLAGVLLCASHVLNALAPRLAGQLQVVTTAAKLIPLVLVAAVGIAVGGAGGRLWESFSTAAAPAPSGGLMASAVAVAFAYEGWVLAVSIQAELRNPRRDLPLALVLGSFGVVAIYILYYIGLHGAVTPRELMAGGEAGAKLAFQRLFGPAAGWALFLLIFVSCLGALNGLTLACCRGLHSLAVRGRGPSPALFAPLDPVTGLSPNSALASLGFSAWWLLYYYGANLQDPAWFGRFSFDSSELPVVTLYAMYVPLFLQLMRKAVNLPPFKRFLMPGLGLLGCGFMVYAAFAGYGVQVFYYLVVYAAVMGLGEVLYRRFTEN